MEKKKISYFFCKRYWKMEKYSLAKKISAPSNSFSSITYSLLGLVAFAVYDLCLGVIGFIFVYSSTKLVVEPH
jgi:hypothetical protein